MWNKDELEGKGKKIKGNLKEKIGELTGNENLEQDGLEDQAEGAAQETFGRARRKVGEAIENAAEGVNERLNK